MNIWLAVALILAVISIYLFVIEAFSVAFKLTGLATKKIRFQVASLFTSAGFTTAESELITNDDRRRRIATVCMYTGHIFSVLIMGLVINVLFSIGTTNTTVTEQWYFIVFYVSLGLFLGKHAVAEVILNKIPPFAQELTLLQMELTKKYAINILSIKRGKRIVEVTKDTMFRKGDILIIYGLTSDIQNAFVNSLDEKNKTIVIDRTNELTLLSNYGTNALMEVVVDEVPKELENIKMKDSHLTDRYGINIVVIRRKDEYLSADKETIILEGDRITLFGPYSNIKHLFNNANK